MTEPALFRLRDLLAAIRGDSLLATIGATEVPVIEYLSRHDREGLDPAQIIGSLHPVLSSLDDPTSCVDSLSDWMDRMERRFGAWLELDLRCLPQK